MHDYFEILGVSPDARAREIQRACRAACRAGASRFLRRVRVGEPDAAPRGDRSSRPPPPISSTSPSTSSTWPPSSAACRWRSSGPPGSSRCACTSMSSPRCTASGASSACSRASRCGSWPLARTPRCSIWDRRAGRSAPPSWLFIIDRRRVRAAGDHDDHASDARWAAARTSGRVAALALAVPEPHRRAVRHGAGGLHVLGAAQRRRAARLRPSAARIAVGAAARRSRAPDDALICPASTTLKLDPNVAAALSYLCGMLSGIAFLILEKQNRYVRFHAMQSTITFILVLIADLLLMGLRRGRLGARPAVHHRRGRALGVSDVQGHERRAVQAAVRRRLGRATPALANRTRIVLWLPSPRPRCSTRCGPSRIPDLHKDIVALGFVKNLRIDAGGRVGFTIELTTPACPVKDLMRDQARAAVSAAARACRRSTSR